MRSQIRTHVQRERDNKDMKISTFWCKGFMSMTEKYVERVRKFFFLARHHVKAELTVIFISLSLVNICQDYIGLY